MAVTGRSGDFWTDKCCPDTYNEFYYCDNISWLDRVIDIVTAPPASPAQGDRYLVIGPATGTFQGYENQIAVWFDQAWRFCGLPDSGSAIISQTDTSTIYTFDGLVWNGWSLAGSFLDLTDTPSTYPLGTAGYTVVVNGTEDGLEFVAGIPGSGGLVDTVTDSGAGDVGLIDTIASTPTDRVLRGLEGGFGIGITNTPNSITHALSATGTPDTNTFLRGDNTWAAPPTSGQALAIEYRFDTGITGAGIASGDLRYNNAVPASITEVYMHYTSNQGSDISVILAALQEGDQFYIQRLTDAGIYVTATINGTPVDNGTYFTFPVLVSDSGLIPGNNNVLGVILIASSNNPTIANDPIWVAKGDLAVGTGPSTAIILPVGADGDVIEVDSTEPSGLKYVTPQKNNDVNSTGLLTGGVMSTGTGASEYSLTDGTGQIVTQTGDKTLLSWTGLVNVTPTNIATQLITFVGIEDAGGGLGQIVEQTTPFTHLQTRSIIVLGVAVHVDNVNVDVVNNEQHVSYNVMSQLYDLAESIGFFNEAGNLFGPNGANLSIDKSVGNIFKMGSNYDIDPNAPHLKLLPSLTLAQFQYRFSNGASGPLTDTLIDPDNLDDGAGGLTALTNNRWSVQRIYSFISNNVKIQRGVSEYTSQEAAINGIGTEPYVTEPSIAANGLLRGWLIVQEGATDLSDLAEAIFLEAPKFGQGSGTTASATPVQETTFLDNVFRVLDNSDVSKQLAFQVDQVATATTRTITMSDHDYTIAPEQWVAAGAMIPDTDLVGTQVTADIYMPNSFAQDVMNFDPVTDGTALFATSVEQWMVDISGVKQLGIEIHYEAGATAINWIISCLQSQDNTAIGTGTIFQGSIITGASTAGHYNRTAVIDMNDLGNWVPTTVGDDVRWSIRLKSGTTTSATDVRLLKVRILPGSTI